MTSLGFLSSMACIAYFRIFGGLRGFVNSGMLDALMVCTHPKLPWLQYVQRICVFACTHTALPSDTRASIKVVHSLSHYMPTRKCTVVGQSDGFGGLPAGRGAPVQPGPKELCVWPSSFDNVTVAPHTGPHSGCRMFVKGTSTRHNVFRGHMEQGQGGSRPSSRVPVSLTCAAPTGSTANGAVLGVDYTVLRCVFPLGERHFVVTWSFF